MKTVTAWRSVSTENRHYLIEEVILPHSPEDLNSFSRQVPGGVYTTFRTYDRNKILPLDFQVQRLDESARLVGLEILLDKEMILDFLRQALDHMPGTDARVRLSIDLEKDPGTLYLGIEPLKMLPESVYASGVWVVTRPVHRQTPKAKQTSFIPIQEKTLESLPEGAHEALLVDEQGNILEGLSSNFFGVLDGQLRTAECGVLPGITRSLVLEAARRENIPVVEKSINIADVPFLKEAFLTSSSRSVLPIRQIDNSLLGTGQPGPMTQLLARAYRIVVRAQLMEV